MEVQEEKVKFHSTQSFISEDLPEGVEGDLAKIMGFRMELIWAGMLTCHLLTILVLGLLG